MRLTKKLLSFLHRVFDKDPAQFLALRLNYDGSGMTWAIADGVLTTVATGGHGGNLSVPLAGYTITTLVGFLAAQPGYSVSYADSSANAQLSATVLLDGSGDVNQSNGNALFGYTGFLYSYLEAQAQELAAAEAQIAQALAQMNTKTAAAEWLDLLGSYYGVPRLVGEADAQYGPRIIPEVLRPRGNNIAIQAAITAFTGQVNTVTDAVNYGAAAPAYGGAISFNGAQTFSTAATPVYGLFDVAYSYDLLGGTSVASFSAQVKDLVNRMRDAGTQMRALLLQSSAITDTVPAAPTDGDAAQLLAAGYAATDAVAGPTSDVLATKVILTSLTDTAAGATGDSLSLTYAAGYVFSGTRSFNGSITFSSGSTSESL